MQFARCPAAFAAAPASRSCSRLSLPLCARSTKFRSGVYGKGAYQQEQYRDLIGMGIFNSNPPLWKEQRRCAAMLFTIDALKQHGQSS